MIRQIGFIGLVFVGLLFEATFLKAPLGLVILILGQLLATREPVRGGGWSGAGDGSVAMIGVLFIVGALGDIMMIRAAGITGGIYAVVVFLFMLYSRKFEVGRMGYLLPYTGLVVGVYSWYFYGEWAWQTVAALAVVVFVRLITNMGSRKYDTLRA